MTVAGYDPADRWARLDNPTEERVAKTVAAFANTGLGFVTRTDIPDYNLVIVQGWKTRPIHPAPAFPALVVSNGAI